MRGDVGLTVGDSAGLGITRGAVGLTVVDDGNVIVLLVLSSRTILPPCPSSMSRRSTRAKLLNPHSLLPARSIWLSSFVRFSTLPSNGQVTVQSIFHQKTRVEKNQDTRIVLTGVQNCR
jgi:hypothetical protein